MPAALPISPSTSDSASTSRSRSRGVRPSTPSSANCCARLATLSASTENTRKAPVNSATSASTVEVDAVGARQVAHALGRIAGLGDLHARWPARRLLQRAP